MSRSRALNRFNRVTAKKRRRSLRADVPSLNQEFRSLSSSFDHSLDLLKDAQQKEALFDLMEVNSNS